MCRPGARAHSSARAALCCAVLLCGLAACPPLCLAQPSSGGAGPGEGDLRLVDGDQGSGYEYGRLEVFLRGQWGNVCQGSLFTPDAGVVACRQLGYDGGARLEFIQAYSRSLRNLVLTTTDPALVSEVDCDGTESRLLDCSANTAADQTCQDDLGPSTARRGIVLACSNAIDSCDITPPEEEGSVRLRGGFGSPCDQLHTGFVEVFHNGVWGSVVQAVDFIPPNLSSDVVCRQLGFPHGTRLLPVGDIDTPPPAITGSDYDYNSVPQYSEEAEEPSERIWLDRVQCSGPEARLVDCDLRRGEEQLLGVADFFVRRAGRLTVACRSFAVAEAREAVTTPGAEEGDLRLVDETAIDNWTQGRLEVFFEGSWAQVCPFAFDASDAHVACRQLGFTAGTVLSDFASDAASPSPKPLVFPEVAISKSGCTGSEARLVDCPVDPRLDDFIALVNFRDCFSTSNPGLYLACVTEPVSGVEEGSLRLRDREESGGEVSGVLEVFHAGAWGTVCDGGADPRQVISEFEYFGDDYFSGINPSAGFVACKQLGFANGDFDPLFPSMADDDRSPPWVGALLCVGSEDRLVECPGIVFGQTEGCQETQRLTCTT